MKNFSKLLIAVPLLVGGIAFSGMQQTIEAQQSSNDVRLRTARFWRGDGRTLLQGAVGLPLAATNRRTQLSVRDSAGNVLHTEAWSDTVRGDAPALAVAGAEVISKLELVLSPGLYSIVLKNDQNDSTTANVRGFPSTPLLSDMVLSARMRVLADKEAPTSAEMRRGRYAIESGTRVTLVPGEPRLWYYLELYQRTARDSAIDLTFRVMRSNSDSALFSVSRRIAIGERGAADAAALLVQGLPPGDYRLVVTARSAGSEEHREAEFTMGSFQTAPIAVAAPGATDVESRLMDRYFTLANASDELISDLISALQVAAPAGAVSRAAVSGFTHDAQRRFLARYWSRISDPVPATPQHELLEEYRQRVEHIKRNFAEQRGLSAVATDRGRIYLKHGAPDARQEVQMANRRTVQLWKYTRQRNIKFAFLDETGFQNYNMIYVVGDPAEQSMADWADRVGRDEQEAIKTIVNF